MPDFTLHDFTSRSDDDGIYMPSKRPNDKPVDAEVNDDAPKDISVPTGINPPPVRRT
jgi:hypothetical protein